jgi:hypothetical protein
VTFVTYVTFITNGQQQKIMKKENQNMTVEGKGEKRQKPSCPYLVYGWICTELQVSNQQKY